MADHIYSDAIISNGDRCPVKFATVSASSSGDNTLVSAVSGKKILVLHYILMASAAVNAKFKSGASTDITGLLYPGANGGATTNNGSFGNFKTATGEALVLNLSGAIPVGGHLAYAEIA